MGIQSSPYMLNRALQMVALLVILLLVMLVSIVSAGRQAKAEPARDGVYLVKTERGHTAKAPVSAEPDSAADFARSQLVHGRNGNGRRHIAMDEHRIIATCRADAMLSR